MEMRSIPGYEGLYSASEDGRIWSHRKCIWLKHSVKEKGYLRVTFSEGGKKKTFEIQRLVARAWIGPQPRGLDVNHIDGIKANNRPGNLEYLTRKKNVEHAMKMGLMVPSRTRLKNVGIRQRKLTIEQAHEIQKLYSDGHLQKHLSVEFGVSKTTIRNIIFGQHYVAILD